MHRHRSHICRALGVVRILLVWLVSSTLTPAQSTPLISATPSDTMSSDYVRLEQSLQSVIEENARLSAEIETLKAKSSASDSNPAIPDAWQDPTKDFYADVLKRSQTGFIADYDNGIVIRPASANSSPYSLKINHQNTFRYTGFARDETTWTDSAGNVLPITDRTDFAIPRGRLIFSGNALMPDMSYLLNIDYNSVNSNPIGFRAYSLSYRFSRGLQAHVGQTKVPGTREWIASSFDAQEGPDRSMATTFFRPSLSQGFWFTGEPLSGLNYIAMISNGFNTLNLRTRELNDRVCFSESIWWEPLGDFGRGYSDIEAHRNLAVRLGSSFTFTTETGSQESDYLENTSIRLSDGTLITQQGALAPAVTVQSFDLALYAIDLALKYRGLSFSTELYHQGLSSIRGNGPLPINSLQSYGAVFQGGYFIIPQSVEVYSRNSVVTGAYGSGSEVAGGFNWFVLKGKSNLRYTFDTAWIDSSPADQNRTGFVAGQSGVLLRTQITSSF